MDIKQKIPQRSYSGICWTTNKSNKKRLMIDFERRCAYCDDADKYAGGSKVYHVEHFAPKEKFPKLEFTYDNLLYACPYCNISKSNKWPSDNSTINVYKDNGFADPCVSEYNTHLQREKDGTIIFSTPLGKYMFFELKLYLKRHELIYNIERIHSKLKEVKNEIEKKKEMNKSVVRLETLYQELCVVFYEYYDVFSDTID